MIVNLDAAAQRTLKKPAHLGDSFVDVERTRVQALPARKRQDLVGKLGTALCSHFHIGQSLGKLPIDTSSGQTLFQKTDITQDHREQIVEVMRYARGQLANGF